MNNWRLLLLAVVAVFQPITSFTERILVDGRHQCCDRQSPTPFRDSRSSLHGTYQLDKTSAARLNDWDEIREGRRYELRQRDSVFTRPSTERPLLEVQERGPSVKARPSRVEYRLERISDDQSRDRERERSARNIRDLKPEYQIRKVVDRTSRDALERRDDRANIEYSHRSLSRNNNWANRFSNERLSKIMYNPEIEMQREQFRSGELRLILNKEVRDVLRRLKNDVIRVEASNYLNSRQKIVRERLNVVRRETAVRADIRRDVDNNNDRRELGRYSEQRRSLSENTALVDRNRDVRIRLNSREENRENRHGNVAHKRLTTERFDERRQQRDDYMESRRQNKENSNRRLSRERMQMSRRIAHESRNMNENNQNKREIRNKMTTETRNEIKENHDKIRDNRDRRPSQTRIEMDRKNSRESRIRTENARDVDSRREIRYNDLSRETRKGLRENPDLRLSRERIQMDQRNNRESRIMSALNERDVTIRGEIRHEGISWNTGDERESPENRLSHEMITLKNIREFRVMNNVITRNDRGIDSRREIRYNRISRNTRDEIRENPDRLSRERVQMDRRNIREFKIMNDMITRNNRDVESRLEIRYNERLTTENRETPNRRIIHERIKMDPKNTRESRIMNTVNERNVDSRREIRHNERLSGETWNEITDTLDRKLARKSSQMDRRYIRESRIINDMTTRNERDIERRRENRYSERLSRNIRNNQFTLERRVESRFLGGLIVVEKDNLVTNRRARSLDRRNIHELRTEPKFSRSADLVRGNDIFRSRVEHSYKIENREREATDARFRNVESARNQETLNSKMEIENDSSVGNWQYVLYTLQGAYLCALFMQMLTPSRTEKARKINLRWLPLSSHYNPIKVD